MHRISYWRLQVKSAILNIVLGKNIVDKSPLRSYTNVNTAFPSKAWKGLQRFHAFDGKAVLEDNKAMR